MMQCPSCKQPYSASNNHIPRILIACGHTICEKCITSKSKDYNKRSVNQADFKCETKFLFECPECKTLNEGESI